jgi:hypothetical protein
MRCCDAIWKTEAADSFGVLSSGLSGLKRNKPVDADEGGNQKSDRGAQKFGPRGGIQAYHMNVLKQLLLIGYLVEVTGCATSPVTPTGPQSYSLSATRCGLCVPVTSYVTGEANKFCDSHEKHMIVRNVTSNNMQPMFPGSATINFECVRENTGPTVQSIVEECKIELGVADLDPIRHKVELFRAGWDAPPPFEVASNDSYPTGQEMGAIAKWATLRDSCLARQRAVPRVPPSATPLQAAFIQQDAAFGDEVTGKVSALIVVLYQGKLKYGEFAEKRYEFSHDGAAAEREFRQATLISDQQRAAQAQQLAQQNFQNRLLAWSTYIQAVNARAPQTEVRVQQNVTIQR